MFSSSKFRTINFINCVCLLSKDDNIVFICFELETVTEWASIKDRMHYNRGTVCVLCNCVMLHCLIFVYSVVSETNKRECYHIVIMPSQISPLLILRDDVLCSFPTQLTLVQWVVAITEPYCDHKKTWLAIWLIRSSLLAQMSLLCQCPKETIYLRKLNLPSNLKIAALLMTTTWQLTLVLCPHSGFQ